MKSTSKYTLAAVLVSFSCLAYGLDTTCKMPNDFSVDRVSNEQVSALYKFYLKLYPELQGRYKISETSFSENTNLIEAVSFAAAAFPSCEKPSAVVKSIVPAISTTSVLKLVWNLSASEKNASLACANVIKNKTVTCIEMSLIE